MDNPEILAKVMALIKPFVRNEAAFKSATPQTRILEDLGVNSARLVDIVLSFEDEFHIEIDDESADKVRTLGDAVEIIQTKTSH